MNWYTIFYWITVADGVKHFFDTVSDVFTSFTVVSFVCLIITSVIRSSISSTDHHNADDDIRIIEVWVKLFKRVFSISIFLCIITWMGYIFLPTKKDALLIVAGGSVGNFITSDSSSKKVPAEVMQLLREKIKSEIQNIKNPINTDTLEDKTKEELIELYKNKK